MVTMIRPEVSEEMYNEVRLLSEDTVGNFDNSLRILVEKYKKLNRRSKTV